MLEWVTGLSTVDTVFFLCAAVGGVLFLLRVVLVFIGFDHDADADAGFDADGVELGHGDHDMGAGMLSFTGLTAFFMLFGITGLVMRLEQGLGAMVSSGIAFMVGLFTMWLVAQVLRAVYRLRSSGNVDANNAVGEEGRVYLTIPGGGRGQVEVTVQGRLKVLDAVAEQPGELKTGAHVRVVRVIEGNVLVVEKA